MCEREATAIDGTINGAMCADGAHCSDKSERRNRDAPPNREQQRSDTCIKRVEAQILSLETVVQDPQPGWWLRRGWGRCLG